MSNLGPAAELSAEVGEILFQLNSHITRLKMLKDDAKDQGKRILAMRTHNANAMVAGGTLLNTVPIKIDELLIAYRIMVKSLEDFREEIG